MEANFSGASNVIRTAPRTLRTPLSGAVANISGLGEQLSFAGFSAYSAAKFALEGVGETLAQEMKPLGIKVLIVELGQFRTNLVRPSMRHMCQMEVYHDVVGNTRRFAHDMRGTQPGDPLKAAAAVETAFQASETPLRLQLNADAIDAVRDHSITVLRELATKQGLTQ